LGQYSRRVLEFSKSDKYKMNDDKACFSATAKSHSVDFSVVVERGRVKKLNHKPCHNTAIDSVSYALCALLENSQMQRIESLSAREVESFLRDQNHVSSMEGAEFPSEFIELFCAKLMGHIFSVELSDGLEMWQIGPEASYVDKINAISDFFTLRVNTLGYLSEKNIEVECIHLSETELVIGFKSGINNMKLAPNTLNKELLGTLEELVRSVIQCEKINLVAE